METTIEEVEPGMELQQEQMLPVLKGRNKMKVLVAVDDSDASFYALQWAVDHLFVSNVSAPEEELEKLTILHVQEPLFFPAGPGFVTTSPVRESIRIAQEHSATTVISRALQICKERLHMHAKVETLILSGDPKETIRKAVKEFHPELLVVGSRGRSKLKRTFLGSVSDYCAHHVKCPVLIVKPPKEAK